MLTYGVTFEAISAVKRCNCGANVETNLRASDYDYALPSQLIAQRPSTERSASRLLVVPPQGDFQLTTFIDLAMHLRPGDLMVFNDTRVIPARMLGRKDTGGKVEVLVEELLCATRAIARTGSSKPLRAGASLLLARHDGGTERATLVARHGEGWELSFENPVREVMEHCGHVPLPPYITRTDTAEDGERYQTIFSRVEGAIAAPTAALHFDSPLMKSLGDHGVDTTFITLHVGAGTFAPMRAENPAEHVMHEERFEVSARAVEAIAAARAQGRRIVAVGTTTVRALESASRSGELQPYSGRTDLFIMPGFEFRTVDALITNFHLPRSTLLMLVSAFAGYQRTMAAYQFAVREQMRFFSYGDAMFLTGQGRKNAGRGSAGQGSAGE